MDESTFDQTTAGLYRAATGEITWDAALEPVQAAFGARAAVIQTIDVATGRIVQLSHGGPIQHDGFLNYLRRWHLEDPRRQWLLSHADQVLDRWWSCHDHFDERFVASHPFYRHFLPAHATRYLDTTLVSPGPGLVSAFAIERSAERGPLTADERHLAERLGRHASEALRQHERVRRMASAALAGHQLLSAFAYPMWLLDEDRWIYYANPAATAHESQGARMRRVAERLQVASAVGDRQLGERLSALARSPHGRRTLVDARRNAADPIAWLHLQTIDPVKVLGAFGDRPLVMATLFSADHANDLDPFALGDVFGLTPTQSRVAVLLAEGITAGEIALRLGCAVSTVRTHIRQVMARLGARRMADAVRLLHQGEALWARARASAE